MDPEPKAIRLTDPSAMDMEEDGGGVAPPKETEDLLSPMRAAQRTMLVDEIHRRCAETKTRCVIYIVGGGALAAGWLFGRPGASAWLLESLVPYGKKSMRELFHPLPVPASFASEDTSIALARLACQRAQVLSEEGVASFQPPRFVGLGFTGALTSVEAKKGGPRAFISTATELGAVESHTLRMPTLGRDKEEIITSELILLVLAKALAVPTTTPFQFPTSGVTSSSKPATASVASFAGDSSMTHLLYRPGELRNRPGEYDLIPAPSLQSLVLSGSFNPLHIGHTDLARVAQTRFPDLPLVYELAMVNVDKGALEVQDITRRLKQFTERGVVVTKHPRFYEKAELLKNCVFVVGADTAVRIVDNKYYASEKDKIVILSRIVYDFGCKFLVGGRLDSKRGEFTTCEEEVKVLLPTSLFEDGFVFLSEIEFRKDISSSELRAKGSTL